MAIIRTTKRQRWLPVIGLLLAWPVVTKGTNGIEPIDVSMQARARGGADVAVGDSALSQVDNPASLSLQPTQRFDFSGQVCFPTAKWSSPIDATESQIKMVPIANVGLAFPVNDRLSWGLAVHSKAGLGSSYNMRHLLIPWMDRRVGADCKAVGLLWNIAYKLTDKLSVGAGVRGEVATTEFSLVLGPADVDFGRGYAYGGGFQLGLHYRVRDDLSFGLAYRSPSWFGDLSGGRGQASLLGLVPIDLGRIGIDELRLPQKITAGVAWDVTDWLKLVGEVRWINYANSSYHDLTVTTDRPISLRTPLPLGYQDQWVIAVGAEFKLDDHWKLGVGYNYGTEPVSRKHLLPMGSTIAQHHFTTGLRYEKDNWWLGAGYILGFKTTMSGGGSSRVPLGIDYAYSTIEQTQHSVVFGFGYRW